MDLDEFSLVAEHFDASFYFAKYPDVERQTKGDQSRAVGHYVTHGWIEGRDPTAWFSSEFYRNRYTDVTGAECNPFLHFLTTGWKEGRFPLPHFESLGCGFDYPTLPESLLTAAKQLDLAGFLDEFERLDRLAGFERSPAAAVSRANEDWRSVLRQMVDQQWTEAQYGLDRERFSLAVESGALMRAEPNSLFDADWYARTYALESHDDPLQHYLRYGWAVSNNPGPYFDSTMYRVSSGPIGDEEPLGHFFRVGRRQNRFPVRPSHDLLREIVKDDRAAPVLLALRAWLRESGILNEDWYAWFNDLASPEQAETHYWAEGLANGARPNPYFDPQWYLNQYPEVKKGSWSPVFHYAIEGWVQDKDPSPRLNTRRFRSVAGEGLPFKTLRDPGGVPSGAIAPAYPAHTPGSDSDIGLDRRYPPRDLVGPGRSYDPSILDIHWLIPDFGQGGGGHTNIFRIAHLHNEMGHRSHVWIVGHHTHHSKSQLARDAHDWYGYSGEIDFLADDQMSEVAGDVVVATAWQTVFAVQHLQRFRRRFYFVQDYEPMFYPAGSMALAAEETYRRGFDCICASPWLAEKMRRDFGLWSTFFYLVPNTDLYFPVEARPINTTPRLVVYAREGTSRRCVELLHDSLLELACRGVAFEVFAFGISEETAGKWRSLGVHVEAHLIVPPAEVAEQYRSADLGIALSATNYSLAPPEMMACGLPVVDLSVESTRASYLDGTVSLAEPNARSVADAIEQLLARPQDAAAMAAKASSWVADLGWSTTATMIADTFDERILANPLPKRASSPLARVTVAIPTLNAAEFIDPLMTALNSQRTDWPFEVLVVDSASDDDTVRLASERGARVISIERKNFQHGRTRNFAVHSAHGEFVAFLTQDAIPDNDLWLQRLVQPMLDDPMIAGCFGRHRAHVGASEFTASELDTHFDGFLAHPAVVSKNTDRARYESGDPGWRQFLYFYSDNNSCLRKSAWRALPYPAIGFGEDQAWAQLVIDSGLKKAYVDDATVRHSHDFDPEEARLRGWEEALFFASWFGLIQLTHERDRNRTFEARARQLQEQGEVLGLSHQAIRRKMEVEAARLDGVLYGSNQKPLPEYDPTIYATT